MRRVDVDPDGVRRARMLADGAQAQADRRLEDDDVRHDQEGEAEPDHQVHLADHVADERDVLTAGSVTLGCAGCLSGRALVAVDVDEEVAGDAEREEVDRRAADDLVGAQRIDITAWMSAVSPRENGTGEAELPRVELVGGDEPKNAPISIIPSSRC